MSVFRRGTDAFTIKRIAGHSSVTVSEKYVHPTPESLELAFRRFEEMGSKRLTESPREAEITTNPLQLEDGQRAAVN